MKKLFAIIKSPQLITILLLSLITVISILLFSFGVLIPTGKNYRSERILSQEERVMQEEKQSQYSEIFENLKMERIQNRHVIEAFSKEFDLERFEKENSKYFESLKISRVNKWNIEVPFELYDVNATTFMNSPQNFYNFIDSLVKNDSIISVEFPIKFIREKQKIHASFKMKVYALSDEKDEGLSEAK